MKYLTIAILFSSHLMASSLEKMTQKLTTYQEVVQLTCTGDEPPSDHGLILDVSCEFKCLDGISRMERVRSPFIPEKLGLTPGNGSTDKNILWSSVGVSMKVWTQRICLEKAATGCKGVQQVLSSDLKEVESGKWKIEKFPGCHEKSITVSPFNDHAGSIRALPEVAKLATSKAKGKLMGENTYALELEGLHSDIPLGLVNVETEKTKFDAKTCQKVIKGSLCFGDCVDLKDEANLTETLGTTEPLGSDEVFICADELVKRIKNEKLSPQMREQLCENYFWQSLLNLDYRLFRSCAALRGEIDCKGF